MTKLLECDVAVMGSGVAGMGAAYKLANAGDLKIAPVFPITVQIWGLSAKC